MPSSTPSAGYVYILREEGNQEFYKVGKTTQKPAIRAKQQSGPFSELIVEFFLPFHDHHAAEKAMHLRFAEVRRDRKEVFRVSFEKLKQELQRLYELEKEKNSGAEALVNHQELTYTMVNQENRSEGTIKRAEGDNQKANQVHSMSHQRMAQKELSNHLINKSDSSFAGIISLPTGGGKTFTIVEWLLEHWLAKGRRVIWLAHRTELLKQAFETFQKHCYRNLLKEKESIKFIIISGEHDNAKRIKSEHELLIASVASLHLNLAGFSKQWVVPNQDQEVMLVIDEAHHEAAVTYRKIIRELQRLLPTLKIVGLTATPYRTEDITPSKSKRKKTKEAESPTPLDTALEANPNELKSTLGKIFVDNIIYSVSLQKLIEQKVLSNPRFIDKHTGVTINIDLTPSEVRNIEKTDILTPALTEQLGGIKRSRFIVEDYLQNRETYGKTLLFAINREHALQLYNLLAKAGVRCDYVISGKQEGKLSNAEKIAAFRKNDYDLLVNVNILTEGTDLPDVHTVLLARPTTSSILMMQMIGRALRGEKAGGTAHANIVIYTDNFDKKIRFINPESLFISENTDFDDADSPATRETLKKLISLAQIEEFNKIARGLIGDDSPLFHLDFLARVPVGSYFLKGENPTHVLVFSHLKDCYERFVDDLDTFFKNSEKPDYDALVDQATRQYFAGYEKTLGFDDYYIEQLLQYYHEEDIRPRFIPFADRETFDLDQVAKEIVDKNLTSQDENNLLNQIWDDGKERWQLFFGLDKASVFRNEVHKAKDRYQNPDDHTDKSMTTPLVEFSTKSKRLANKSAVPATAPEVVPEVELPPIQPVSVQPQPKMPEEAAPAPIKVAEMDPFFLQAKNLPKQIATKVIIQNLINRNCFYAKEGTEIFTERIYVRSAKGNEKRHSLNQIVCPTNAIVNALVYNRETIQSGEDYAKIIPVNPEDQGKNEVLLFGMYKEQLFRATFLVDTQRIAYQGQKYNSATAAAEAAIRAFFRIDWINGRDFWRYIDFKQGTDYRLGDHPIWAEKE